MSTTETEATTHPDPASPGAATALQRTAGAETLERLLAEVPDDDLRAKLMEAYARAKPKKFGLVFEDHEPDAVTLPAGTRIRRGDLVRREVAGKAGHELFQVVTTGRRGLQIAPVSGTPGAGELGDPESVEDPSQLRVVKAWGAPVYPGLSRISEPVGDTVDGAPEHLLIQGENLHALQALRYTHAGKVDLIYIDPPYNTGNRTWIYNDQYVAEKDTFRHSKWLAFMEHRLTVARGLLTETGVIVVAIGDEEHHRLRMLMDEIFGTENFISSVVWYGSRKNDSRLISNAADYMLVYARNQQALLEAGTRWREIKAWADEVLVAGEEAWAQSQHDSVEATKRLKAWFSSQPKGRFTASQKHYSLIDNEGRVFSEQDPGAPGRDGPRYDVLHPVTGQPCRIPVNGWRYTKETFDALIADGRVYFREDHTSLPRPKTFLYEQTNETVESVFYASRKASSHHLLTLLGDKRFPYAKDHEVLMRWIRLMAPRDGVVLDFFAGSGTTGEAVMRLNAEDGGARQAILVTNNELGAKDDARLRKAGHVPGDEQYEALGVCRHVTIPRLNAVVTGKCPDGTEHKHGVLPGARFSAWKLDYLDPVSVEMGAQFAAIAPLLWAESGCLGPVIEEEPLSWEATEHYGVLVTAAGLDAFAEFAEERAAHGSFTAWIVTDTDAEWAAAADRLPPEVTARRLWRHYVRSFEINVPGRIR